MKRAKRILSLILTVCIVSGFISALPISANAEGGTNDCLRYQIFDNYVEITGLSDDTVREIVIPSEIEGLPVTSIGVGAFGHCNSLTSITIPDSVASIGEQAFYNCISLTSVAIPNSVTSIGDSAFYGCESLTSITIPNSVTSIGEWAFRDCKSLTSVTIPNSVTSIGGSAFYECKSLTSVTIPDSVTSIGERAFSGCASLTSIDVGSGNSYYCSLNGVLFDKNKTTLIQYPIGKSQKNYTIPSSVTSIGERAFSECTSLTSITIPNSVTSIGKDAFGYCKSLTSITIPDSVTSIGKWVFRYCTSLTSVTIPNSVTSIGGLAFNGCISLTSVTIGNSVASIGDMAFYWCTSLTSITIPNSVTSIGEGAFEHCESLTSVTIPNSVTRIGRRAFYNCTSLTDVYYGGSQGEWSAIRIDPYNECLTGANIYYNIRQQSIDDLKDAIKINAFGRATAYFNLKDKNGSALRNTALTYKTSNGGTGSVTTDGAGLAKIQTPYISYENGPNQKIDVTFSGAELEENQFTLNVTVTPLAFSQKWRAKVTGEAGAKLSFGAGGSIGVLEGEAELASVGANGKAAKTLAVEETHEEDGSTTLSLSSSMSTEAAAKAKVGIFAEGAGLGQNIEVSGGDINGKASLGKDIGYTLKLKNYDPNNNEQLLKMGYFLLDTATDVNGSNLILRKIMELWNVKPYNENSENVTAKLAAGANIGSVKINDVSATVAGLAAEAVYKTGTKVSADNSVSYSSGISAEAGIKLGEIKYKNKFENDFSAGTSSAVWGKDLLNNEISLSVLTKDGKPVNVSAKTMLKNNNKQILWYSDSTSRYKTMTFTGKDMNTLLNVDNELALLSKGKQGFYPVWKVPDTIENMLGENINGSYSVTTEKERGIDASISFGLTAGLGFDFGLGIAGISSREYETEQGQKIGNYIYKTSESEIDNLVEANKSTLTDVLSRPAAALKNKISGMLESVKNSIKDGIEWAGGKLRGAGNAIVTVFKVKDGGTARTYSILTVDNELSLFSTAGESKTVGEPCVISAEAPDGTELTSFEDNPMELTLNYTDEDLAAANISAVMANEIKIYRWSEDNAVYVYVGGDACDMGVTANITKPGQYVLAVDTCPPAVTEFGSDNNGSSPTITAVIADMSGIGEFEFKLDGKTVVNMSNFSDYYNAQTALFSYTAENLTAGEHTAQITASDTRGNALDTPMMIMFNVDTTVPVIGNVSTEVRNGLTVYANVSDDNLSEVYTEILYENQTYTYPMTLENGVWSVDINELPAGEMTVSVAAYDNGGNSAKKEVMTAGKSTDSDSISYCTAKTADNKTLLICEGANAEETERKLMLSAALYSGGRLAGCKTVNATVLSGKCIGCISEIKDGTDGAKIYLWDENMKPVTNCVNVNF